MVHPFLSVFSRKEKFYLFIFGFVSNYMFSVRENTVEVSFRPELFLCHSLIAKSGNVISENRLSLQTILQKTACF